MSRQTAPIQFSVIVPTRDEARNLPRLLSSLVSQEDVTFEVLVVDQDSCDATREIAKDLGCLVLPAPRSAFYSPPSRSRNLGAAASHGNYLVHLDADMELPDVLLLRRLRDHFDDGAEAIVLHEVDVAYGFWSRVKAVERMCYIGTSIESPRAVSRKVFHEIGGYDVDVSSGEDYLMAARLARHGVIARDHSLTLLHHTGSISLWSLLSKKFNYGRTVGVYVRRARSVGSPSAGGLLVLSVASYARHWRVALRDPAHYVGIAILRPLEGAAVIIGMGWSSLKKSGRRTKTG